MANTVPNMTSQYDPERVLGQCLSRWVKLSIKNSYDPSNAANQELIRSQADDCRPYLKYLLQDNSSKTAVELEQIAKNLTPGGAHDDALLAILIHENLFGPCPTLMAAIFRLCWHGGKVGFQLLPRPNEVTLSDYEGMALDLLEVFDVGTNDDPRRILTGEDLQFYEGLGDRLTIYRGVESGHAKYGPLGVCWTTNRSVAEWFAVRSAGFFNTEPVLLSARVRKCDIRMAKASEFEVVTMPHRWKQIICRVRGKHWQPQMVWAEDGN